MICDSYFFLL